MTDGAELVLRNSVGPATGLALNRPERGNALTPALLDDLCVAIGSADRNRPLVVSGAGKAFSSGGDILGFLAHAGDPEALAAHGCTLVGGLNEVILALQAFPAPVLAAVNGPLTGGSLGLALAADRIIMADTAFIQPWYAAMGFAPDGGWTALLPDRIGSARTHAWIAGNDRHDAATCLAMGVCDRVCSVGEFASAIETEVRTLASADTATLQASRRLLRPGEADLKAALDAERTAFLDCLLRPETIARMRAFAAAGSTAREAG